MSSGIRISRRANSPNAGRNSRLGLERVVVRPVENEHRVHFAGRDAVGETRRDEGARTHADIDIADPSASTPLQRLFQRDQRADLIDAAEGTAPSEGDPHFAVATPPVHWTTPGPTAPLPVCRASLRRTYSAFALCARAAAVRSLLFVRQLLGDLRQLGDPLRQDVDILPARHVQAVQRPRHPVLEHLLELVPGSASPWPSPRRDARRRRSWSAPGPSRLRRPAPRTS